MSDKRLDNISIIMDLPRLGELIAAVALKLTQLREIDALDGEEMRELSITAWQHVCFMTERATFAREMQRDLAALPTTETPLLGQ